MPKPKTAGSSRLRSRASATRPSPPKTGGKRGGSSGFPKAPKASSHSSKLLHRESWVKEAGFSEFPKDTKGFLELCKALKAKGHPAGFAHGKAVGDANNWSHWVVWSHGGKMVDENSKVVINSPETVAALRYAREMYPTLIPGTEAWLDINNNRAYLAGMRGKTPGRSPEGGVRALDRTQRFQQDPRGIHPPKRSPCPGFCPFYPCRRHLADQQRDFA